MKALFWRDLRISIRAGGGALTGILFYLAVAAVVPFAVGHGPGHDPAGHRTRAVL